MLYLLNKDVRTVRWNGEPLHEATSAIVKETMNGDFTLTVKYPISDSGIYQLIQEDMLIKAPTPVLGAQLFRIKKPVEHNDHLEITAYHISDDVMQRSITPVSVTSQSCGMALSRMVQNTKTVLGDFSFNSDIQDRRTFNTTETETLYSVLLDGKHSIVGTWEGELVRDNFAITVKKSRGENRGVVITTHKNLKDYQRTRNSQNVVTRIHAKSTFKPEGSEKETTLRVTVDSPLINSYPYINEKEYENNNAKTVEELQKWAQAKFSNEGIDKVSDAIKIEAYELDGQVVHMGDTVNLKSWKHNVDALKKAIAYEFDALKEEYISLTFDDKAGVGGSRASGGLSSAADAILGVTESAQEIALEKALQNADLDFDHKAGLLRQEISDGIELARARAEEVKRELSDTIDQRFSSFNNGPLQEAKRRAEEALRNAGASTLLAQEAKRIGLDSIAKFEEFKRQATSAQTALSGDLDVLKRTIANDIRPKQEQAEAEIAKQVEALVQTKKELAGVKSVQATYEETTTRRLSELTNLANGKASKSELTQTADELASRIASVQIAHKNQGDRVSAVESSFKQRADALDAGVNRLNEGLRTKADISSLNVTAENIRQSVKSLETDTQNKLNQKLSLAEFEVRAGSIRQEILNATKDKADKTLVTAEAGKLREELASLSIGGQNLALGTSKEWSTPFTNFSGNPNTCPPLYKVLTDGLQVGDTLRSKIILKYTDVRSAAGKTATVWLQGNGNVTGWTAGAYTGSPAKNLNGSGEITFEYSFKITENHLKNAYWNWMFRTDFIASGSLQWRLAKVESGSVFTNWSPAPEDTDGLITEAKATFERTAQGLRTDLSSIQEYVGQDGQRQEALRRYTREESAKQATAVRELVTRDYVGKATYQEDVRGIERRFDAITNPQNGSIATQIATYKNAVDGRFADITSLFSGKANQSDFQRVRETSQLYERIIGNNENDISNKVARMALTNQLFQVEVSKYSGNGVNRALNTTSDWGPFISRSGGNGVNLHADLHKILSSGFKAGDNVHVRMEISIDDVQRFNDKQIVAILQSYGDVTNWTRTGRTFDYNIGTLQPGNNWRLIEFNTVMTEEMLRNNSWMLNLRVDGAKSYKVHTKIVKIEKGNIASAWSPAPEDTEEAVRSVQSQLAGSWSVQNINSAGDLISGLNLGANGHNRLDGKLTHITGETLIDKAVIKSAMVDKLKTANFEAGSVTTIVLDAEAVTAEKLKVDQAFFNKLVANEAYLSQLFAKQAFINRVQSVAIDASQVRSGILSGDRIYGGTIRGANIFGGTLTGHTQIQLGSYGSFDALDGGLQINVPRDYNAKDGLGVQFIGSYGRGEDVPYGLFIYKDSDFTTGGYASRSDDFLLTVEGYIKANGIGWFKTGKGSIDGSSTATIGYWNSSVSLDFGGSGNDIYYSYNGKAYSLWTCVNAHFSDRRLKENIVECKHKALDYIQRFQFKEYDWKKQEDRPRQAHTKIGLIAQEVQAVDPTLVYENGDTLNLDNLRLTNIALKAIQELALENQKLTHRLENLENEYRTA